jgi:hypothetical protein
MTWLWVGIGVLVLAELVYLAVKINRRSSGGTTSVDQRRPLNQTGSVYQETPQSDRELDQ